MSLVGTGVVQSFLGGLLIFSLRPAAVKNEQFQFIFFNFNLKSFSIAVGICYYISFISLFLEGKDHGVRFLVAFPAARHSADSGAST